MSAWSGRLWYISPIRCWTSTRLSATSWRWTSKVSSTCCGMRSWETCEATTGRFGAGQKCDWEKLTICFDRDHSDKNENHSVYHNVIIVTVMKITMIVFKKNIAYSITIAMVYSTIKDYSPVNRCGVLQRICRPCSRGFTSFVSM